MPTSCLANRKKIEKVDERINYKLPKDNRIFFFKIIEMKSKAINFSFPTIFLIKKFHLRKLSMIS